MEKKGTGCHLLWQPNDTVIGNLLHPTAIRLGSRQLPMVRIAEKIKKFFKNRAAFYASESS